MTSGTQNDKYSDRDGQKITVAQWDSRVSDRLRIMKYGRNTAPIVNARQTL